MPQYCHLHNHTEFSLLDGAAKIEQLVKKAHSCGMPAVGISDHGNMFGVPKFVLAAKALGIKPIIGSEFYICHSTIDIKRKENDTFHQILFAKNEEGYKNLIYLSSVAYQEGFYYKPRIDKNLLKNHAKGVIATTCCLASEINQLIIHDMLPKAEELFRWYLELFGEDYYVEIQDHNLRDQKKCNEVLLRWSKKYNVKVIATNDVHYVEQADSEAHDLLLALQTGSDYNDPKRFRFNDDQNKLNPNFYFKTQEEMLELFPDHPEAMENTIEIADKCSFELSLTGDLILPIYKIPPEFENMDDYLRYLTYEGAKKKYGEITATIEERLEQELKIIKQVGYAGYFLIVQEFTNEARKRGVYVGPGRGSAAGSAVAYCIGIIDVDPIEYNLLFERFLNPERVSPPDIDIDFDDEGREEVIQFVVDKYGRDCVSQVITYTTMGCKTAIRDVGRAMGIPLPEVDKLAKLIPEKPGMTFKKALTPEENPDHFEELKQTLNSPDEKIRKLMQYAQILEGTTRNTGVHACALIITPTALTNYIPLSMAKGDVVITQYDGPNAEKVGLLKMDFLGLKTLSIMKTAVQMIQKNHGIKIDIDKIPLDDPKTYELYQRGDTVATFQFESDGMRKYLRELKPTCIEDLIAMNALYRPGPMDNIPSFVNRKHGIEKIEYQHPLLEPILKNTYGIMVYQEQIMECARVLAGYSLGGADLLRRAMGKKKAEVMEKERAVFVKGAEANGIDPKTAGEIFDTMEKFASYGFNKSHSAAYSIVAFRTAYLKAHYPSEYMAAVLSHHINSISDITFFIEECRRLGIEVLPPDVNLSNLLFTVAKPNQILFGLAAIKGVGEGSVQGIIQEREKNGPYKSIFDLTSRLDSKIMNKKVLESLVYAGALDSLAPIERSRYFFSPNNDDVTMIDKALQYGNRVQLEKKSAQASLFGGSGSSSTIEEPTLPYCEPWSLIEKLNFEKEVIGFYLSGHPLDRYRLEINHFSNCTIKDLGEMKGKAVRLAGIVVDKKERVTKNGSSYLTFSIQDFNDTLDLRFFRDDYVKFKDYIRVDSCLLFAGRYQQSTYNEHEWELKIDKISYLEGIMEELSKELILQCKSEAITLAAIDNLEQLLQHNLGKCTVKLTVQDDAIPANVTFQFRELKVKPSYELIQQLEKSNFYCNIK